MRYYQADLDKAISNFKLQNVSNSKIAIIGVFDGMHAGHVFIISKLQQIAKELKLYPILINFHPRPKDFIRNYSSQTLLITTSQRIKQFQKFPEVGCMLLEFNQKIKNLTAQQFFSKLKRKLNIVHWLFGEDSVLGSDRADINQIKLICKKLDIAVSIVATVNDNGKKISSHQLVDKLQTGDIIAFNKLFGRNYSIEGKVVEGNKRGTKLGFPTTNIIPCKELVLPKFGVYATNTIYNGESKPSATFVGTNPVFGGEESVVETFIFDFDKNIYGEQVEIEFCHFVREEQNFDSQEKLVKQMYLDIQKIKKLTVK